jgi:hypothetical protein
LEAVIQTFTAHGSLGLWAWYSYCPNVFASCFNSI